MLFYKLPNMVYSGLLTGIVLELLLPNEDDVLKKNGCTLNRRHFIIGGICIATWLSYMKIEY